MADLNKRRSELCLIDQNSEEVHNLKSPDEKKIGATIRIGKTICCIPSVGYFFKLKN